MTETAKATSANAETQKQKPKNVGGADGDPIPRRIYVPLRLEEIAATVAYLAKERADLTTELKAPRRAEGPNHKMLRERRAYIAQRLAILRKEQADLNIERKVLGGNTGKRDYQGTRRGREACE